MKKQIETKGVTIKKKMDRIRELFVYKKICQILQTFFNNFNILLYSIEYVNITFGKEKIKKLMINITIRTKMLKVINELHFFKT